MNPAREITLRVHEILAQQNVPVTHDTIATAEATRFYNAVRNSTSKKSKETCDDDDDDDEEILVERATQLFARELKRRLLEKREEDERSKLLLECIACRPSPLDESLVLYVSTKRALSFVRSTCYGNTPPTMSNSKGAFDRLSEAIEVLAGGPESLTKFTVLLDLDNHSLLGEASSPEFDALVSLGIDILMRRNPERLRRVVLTHLGKSFLSIAWPLISSRLPRALFAKIVFAKSPSEVYRYLPATVVPVPYGTAKELDFETESLHARRIFQEHQEAPAPNSSSTPSTLPVKESREREEDAGECLRRAVEDAHRAEAILINNNQRLQRRLESIREARRGLRGGGRKGMIPTEDDGEKAKEAANLRVELQQVREEAEAYARAVRFARNYIEQEARARDEAKTKVQSQIDALRAENFDLIERLSRVFGSSDA